MINDKINTGLYGKLPAHGDFVMRGLSNKFVKAWDNWLQCYISGSNEQIGENWVNYYLTSPIWRFVLSNGCVDSSTWAGILLPSVDNIGRYFPLSIVTSIPSNISSLDFLFSANEWFDKIEEISLQALYDNTDIEELNSNIENTKIIHNNIYEKQSDNIKSEPLVISMEFEEQRPCSMSDYLLESMFLKSKSSYSVWTTKGSDKVSPSVFISQGLPDIKGISGMINGVWTWQQPYKLKAI